MFIRTKLSGGSATMLVLGLAIGGCVKAKPDKPAETARTRAEAKRHKDACASSVAYDRMKRVIFSQAGRELSSHQSNLRTLEEFAFVRMEDPVVEGWDPALDKTRCRGRFILDVPPGSARAFGGEHRLQADITYTAQGAADASGLVYVIRGAEPIIGRLAAFNIADATYRPLPAFDVGSQSEKAVQVENGTNVEPGQAPNQTRSAPVRAEQVVRQASVLAKEHRRPAIRQPTSTTSSAEMPSQGAEAEATVRSFYNALGAGNGDLASAQVIPAKRASRAYSPDAISRFYGRLSEPLRLTGVSALSDDTYRVTYRYAGTGTRCNGSAVVRLTSKHGHPLIRSITAGGGC